MEAKAPTETQKRPIVVAMKGHPGTGKSTVARTLATALAWALLDKDDIKQNLIQFQFHHLNLNLNLNLNNNVDVDSVSASINEACYHVLWAMAKTQLLCGNSVIIDSPLSAPRHFDNAVALCRATGARLLLVHCRGDANPGVWRHRIEQRARFLEQQQQQQQQHKPASWEELQALVQSYHGSYDYPINDTPLLVLDLTAPLPIDDTNNGGHSEEKDYLYLLSRVVEWVRTTSASTHVDSSSSSSPSLITHLP